MARIVVLLRGGERVESQAMDEEAARAELDRVHEEVGPGRTNKFIKLGTNAIFNAEDVDRIQIESSH